MKIPEKIRYIIQELVEHLPYSIFGVTISLILMGVLTFFAILLRAEPMLPKAAHELFHILHPVHILFSAVATTAMFWKHEKNRVKAAVVGFFGSIVVCGLSDILFPFLGGAILGGDMHMHICALEHPFLIVPFTVVGVFIGFFVVSAMEHSTQYSHSAHVLVSSMASIVYLIAYGLTDWVGLLGGVFMVILFAVTVPCCLSDIVWPLVCVHKNCSHPEIGVVKHERRSNK